MFALLGRLEDLEDSLRAGYLKKHLTERVQKVFSINMLFYLILKLPGWLEFQRDHEKNTPKTYGWSNTVLRCVADSPVTVTVEYFVGGATARAFQHELRQVGSKITDSDTAKTLLKSRHIMLEAQRQV